MADFESVTQSPEIPRRGFGPHRSSFLRVGVIGANPRSLETAQITADKFQVACAYGEAAELVQDPSVDVVAITVKVPEHDVLTRMALEAGKHVFSEWPLRIDLAEATQLAELASRSGLHHMVGLQGLWAPGPLFLRDLIERGAIGKPVSVSVVAPGSPAGSRVHQSSSYTTDRRAGATVLSVSTGHILATLAATADHRFGQPVPLFSMAFHDIPKKAQTLGDINELTFSEA
jgi:predicted dehydrogenase